MIVLLTDFGDSEYVGVMKGVIYGIAPEAKVVDLCHSVRPQNVIEGSWILKNNYRYFPKCAVFCCVVDPGVGTERRAIAVKTDTYYFVGPDNGLMWEAVKERRMIEIREIAIPAEASRTFHGRDVFAKAAAEIDLGRFGETGKHIERIEELELYRAGREGIVVRIDRFGNIVTNIDRLQKDEYSVAIGEKEYVMGYCATYGAAKEGELFLIEGSCNTLEISLKDGNANERLGLQPGDKIRIS